jgi:hypothetical protein
MFAQELCCTKQLELKTFEQFLLFCINFFFRFSHSFSITFHDYVHKIRNGFNYTVDELYLVQVVVWLHFVQLLRMSEW